MCIVPETIQQLIWFAYTVWPSVYPDVYTVWPSVYPDVYTVWPSLYPDVFMAIAKATMLYAEATKLWKDGSACIVVEIYMYSICMNHINTHVDIIAVLEMDFYLSGLQ